VAEKEEHPVSDGCVNNKVEGRRRKKMIAGPHVYRRKY
jgi:ribosome-associated protein YbcJ (S4-like RNA binding protein)